MRCSTRLGLAPRVRGIKQNKKGQARREGLVQTANSRLQTTHCKKKAEEEEEDHNGR